MKKKGKKQEKELAGPVHDLPEDLGLAIQAIPALNEAWCELTPLAQNEWICWVLSAKKADTRARRIDRAREELLDGKRRPCCWPGCPHRRPSAAKWFKGKAV